MLPWYLYLFTLLIRNEISYRKVFNLFNGNIFLQVDTPLSPSSKGCDTFLKGITHDMKQQYRDRLFDVTKDEVKTVAEKYVWHAMLVFLTLCAIFRASLALQCCKLNKLAVYDMYVSLSVRTGGHGKPFDLS